jgi:flagellar hook-associated protein 2
MAGVSSVGSPTTATVPSTSSSSSSPFVPVAGQGLLASSTGLISGLQTQQIINALLTFDQEPVTQLNNKITTEQSQQSAYSTLSSQLTALQNDAQQLSSSSVLGARTASSSNPSAITATASASAPLASYLVTPVAQAQTQALLSNGFSDSTTAPVGQGTITIKLGGFVNPSTPLSQLNGGAGVPRGQISITDRSGATATVDLSTAQTIDDVVNDINKTAGIHVQASLSGNSLAITDKSGSTSGNLIVQDIANGSTAASLGIAGSVAANSLTGTNLVSLSGNTQLNTLNDNNGVGTAAGVPDFTITLKNGSSFAVQLGSATTLQDVLNDINNNSQNGGKLTASISGTHLVLTDNSGGSGTLTVSALNGSSAAKDLGILGSEQGGGVLTGGQIISGLDTVLLKDLNGGSGITTPGSIQLTDRSGKTATVNLSTAATLNDVITAINGAGLGLSASVNNASDGIQISDTTGQTASNLIVADVGGGTTAANLNIATNTAANSVNSGDLSLRYIGLNTQLSSLNGGAGIQQGSFQITDSTGKVGTVNVTGNISTVGQLITAINTSGVGVRASINATGDGLLLTDTAGGSGTLQVADLGGTTAASLKIAGTAVSGQINGAFRYTVNLGPKDTLSTLQQDLLNSGAPVTTNILSDGGSSQAYHIMIGSEQSGLAGRLLIDTGTTGLSLSTLTPAADAVVQVGVASGNNLLFTSSTNTFSNILPGLTINVAGTSSTPVTVTVGQDSSALITAIQNFVNDFNTVSGTISQDDSYDTSTNTGGVLYTDPTVEQISNTLSNYLTGTWGASSDKTHSLLQMGITLNNGQLSINSSALQAAVAADPSGVQDFLGNASNGMATQLANALQNFTAPFTGAIAQQSNNLSQQITDQQAQITFLNAEIASKTTLLQNEFANMETNLATIQSQGSELSQLSNLATFNSYYANGSSTPPSSSGG